MGWVRRFRVCVGPPARRLTRFFSRNLPLSATSVMAWGAFTIPAGSVSVGTKSWLWIEFAVSGAAPV